MAGKIKDPRLIAVILFYLSTFFHYINLAAYGTEGSATLIDIAKSRAFWSGKIYFIIPMVIIILVLFFDNKVASKVVFLVGSLAGIFMTLFILIFTAERYAKIYAYALFFSGNIQTSPGFGFFLTLAIWAFVLLYTLIRDYAISKDSIKEKGIKATISDIANQTMDESNFDLNNGSGIELNSITSGVSEFVSNVTKKKCPYCEKMINSGDVICTYCGKQINGNIVSNVKPPKDRRLTVTEYIMGIKEYQCDNCGEIVSESDNYCIGCGKPVVIKTKINRCSKCGRESMDSFEFCPNCGAKNEKVFLKTKCEKCGAELLFGKAYCVNCGTKIYE